MDAIQGNAYVSIRLTSNCKIPAPNTLILQSERASCVTLDLTPTITAGNCWRDIATPILIRHVCFIVSDEKPKPAIHDQSMFDLVKELADVSLPAHRHSIEKVFTFDTNLLVGKLKLMLNQDGNPY